MMTQHKEDTTIRTVFEIASPMLSIPPAFIITMGKPPALPGRLPEFDISGNIRKPPLM